MSEQIQVALIGLIGVLSIAVIGTFLKLVFDQSDKKRIEQLLEKTQELSKKLESTASMVGTSDKSLASLIGNPDKSLASLIGSTDKSLASLIGSTDKSLASLIGNTDKSLASLIGDTNHLSVSYKLDTLINENQKHKDALSSMNSDTKQMHTYVLSYTQKFEENVSKILELEDKLQEALKEIQELKEENQKLKERIKEQVDQNEKSGQNSKGAMDEDFDDIIDTLLYQKDDEMDLER